MKTRYAWVTMTGLLLTLAACELGEAPVDPVGSCTIDEGVTLHDCELGNQAAAPGIVQAGLSADDGSVRCGQITNQPCGVGSNNAGLAQAFENLTSVEEAWTSNRAAALLSAFCGAERKGNDVACAPGTLACEGADCAAVMGTYCAENYGFNPCGN